MIIIWRGFGWLVGLYIFLAYGPSFFIEKGGSNAPEWVFSIGLLAAAAATFATHWVLDEHFHDDTWDNTFFLIPVKWWPVPIALVAVATLLPI